MMSLGEKQDLIFCIADDQVEVIQYVSTEYAQICCCRISKTGELSANSRCTAAITGKLQSRRYQNKIASSANSTQREFRCDFLGRHFQFSDQRFSENCAVGPGIDKEIFRD